MSTFDQPEGNPQDCSQPKKHDNHSGSQPSQSQPTANKPISERKRKANRENAKKSTGPRTVRGKRFSSFNAVTHGLLAKKVIYAADGKLMNEDLKRVLDSLRHEYGRGDVASELLTELAAVDYWRMQKVLEYERKYLSPQGGDFHPQGAMPTLIRYMTANRRAFEKSLTTLMQLRTQNDAPGEAAAGDDLSPVVSPRPDTDRKDAPSGGGKKKSPPAAVDEGPSEMEKKGQKTA
jgi:hypothetical protein